MKLRHKILSVFVIIFLISGLVWLYFSKTQKYSTSTDKVTLQLKWLHQAQFAGFYAAQEEGFYKEEGLSVSILPVGEDHSEISVINRVSGGETQFGVAGGDQIILARAEKKPVKAIAVIFQQSPVVLATLASSGIQSPTDFLGKTFGVEKGQNTEFIYRAIMKEAGVDTSKIKEVPLPFGMNALYKGKIDARAIYLINEGVEAQEKGYPLNIIYPDDYGIQTYADTLFTSDELIAQNPDLVRRFLKATLKGWEWAVAHPDQAGALSLRYNPKLSSSHEVSMLKAALPFVYTGKTSIGSMDPNIWQKMQDFLFKYHLLTTPIPLDDVFTLKFLK